MKPTGVCQTDESSRSGQTFKTWSLKKRFTTWFSSKLFPWNRTGRENDQHPDDESSSTHDDCGPQTLSSKHCEFDKVFADFVSSLKMCGLEEGCLDPVDDFAMPDYDDVMTSLLEGEGLDQDLAVDLRPGKRLSSSDLDKVAKIMDSLKGLYLGKACVSGGSGSGNSDGPAKTKPETTDVERGIESDGRNSSAAHHETGDKPKSFTFWNWMPKFGARHKASISLGSMQHLLGGHGDDVLNTVGQGSNTPPASEPLPQQKTRGMTTTSSLGGPENRRIHETSASWCLGATPLTTTSKDDEFASYIVYPAQNQDTFLKKRVKRARLKQRNAEVSGSTLLNHDTNVSRNDPEIVVTDFDQNAEDPGPATNRESLSPGARAFTPASFSHGDVAASPRGSGGSISHSFFQKRGSIFPGIGLFDRQSAPVPEQLSILSRLDVREMPKLGPKWKCRSAPNLWTQDRLQPRNTRSHNDINFTVPERDVQGRTIIPITSHVSTCKRQNIIIRSLVHVLHVTSEHWGGVLQRVNSESRAHSREGER
jgi:hypothetical protein